MPDEFDDDEQPEQQEDRLVQLKRSEIRALQAKAKKADENESRALAAERTLVFRDAGIPNDAKTSYFVKGYDGELTAEAIKTAAIDAGFLAAPEPEVSAEELAAHGRLASASQSGEPGPDPHSTDSYEAALANAKTREEVLALAAQHGSRVVGDRN